MALSHERQRVRARRTTLAMGVLAAAVLAPSVSRASFLDQLFGGTPQAQLPHAAPLQERTLPEDDGISMVTRRYAHAARHDAKPDAKPKHKIEAAADRTPKLQKTTPLVADKTLRSGDAIMLADGVKVYDGPVAAVHKGRQFVPLANARHVSKAERDALVAIVPAPRDHEATTGAGRSAADTVVVSRGYQIQDDRSGTVRYVGP